LREAISISDLAAVLLGRQRTGIVAVLSAFFDASKTEISIGITSVGGYVALVEEWSRLEKEWEEARLYWSLDTFHLADIPKILGNEKGRLCVGYFRRIIRASQLDGIGASLMDKDWNESDWGDCALRKHGSKYEQCLALAFQVLSMHCRQHYPGQPIAVVCDQDAPETDIIRIFREAQIQYELLSTITVGRRRQHIGLQVADLGAGDLRKNWLAFFKTGAIHYFGKLTAGGPDQKQAGAFWTLEGKEVSQIALERQNFLKGMLCAQK
jgi:hypothetical protein